MYDKICTTKYVRQNMYDKICTTKYVRQIQFVESRSRRDHMSLTPGAARGNEYNVLPTPNGVE